MTKTSMFVDYNLLIDLKKITAKDIRIGDIAHNLAMQCRFNGACHCFYSVAEHSLNVLKEYANFRTKEERGPLAVALLHDAHEAYIGDLIRPVFNMLSPESQKEWKALKKNIDACIFQELLPGVDYDFYMDFVSKIDKKILSQELNTLFFPENVNDKVLKIKFYPPHVAEKEFLLAAKKLKIL